MPSTSKTNKGVAKGRRKRHQEFDHKIAWNKVQHGSPKQKRNPLFWQHLLANLEDWQKHPERKPVP